MELNTALKEWAVVTAALERGEQTILLRKGGLIEQTGEFAVEQPRFLLFPTAYHPERQWLRPEAWPLLESALAERPAEGPVRIGAWAEVVESHVIDSEVTARALAAHTVWTPDYTAERFLLQKHRPLLLLVLRVHRLPEPRAVPLARHYGGCTSWVELDETFDTSGSRPALDDAAFARALAAVHATLDAAPAAV